MSTPIRSIPKKRKPLRKVSKKRAKVNRKRRDFVKEVLAEFPWCQAFEKARTTGDGVVSWNFVHSVLRCDAPSTQVHEPRTRGRFPGSDTILDKANAVAVCANCHRQIHDNVALSEACGLLVKSHG